MILKGYVGKLEDRGDAVQATLQNVRSNRDAGWREYCPSIDIRISDYSIAKKAYYIGREVIITIEPQ